MKFVIKTLTALLLFNSAILPSFGFELTPIELSNINTQSIVKIESDINDDYLPCSGTLLANQWVLTAAHCVIYNNKKVQHTDIILEDSKIRGVKEIFVHPDYDTSEMDIALLKLHRSAITNAVIFLDVESPLHHQIAHVVGYGTTYSIKTIPMHISPSYANATELFLNNVKQGNTRVGDSGAPYLLNNQLVGIHNGSLSSNKQDDLTINHAYGVKLSHPDVANFIKQTIDSWHFPNSLQVNGKSQVRIQSLHRGIVAIAAYTQGDVVINYEESSCEESALTSPFETCHFTVESEGGQGKIFLSENEVITVN